MADRYALFPRGPRRAAPCQTVYMYVYELGFCLARDSRYLPMKHAGRPSNRSLRVFVPRAGRTFDQGPHELYDHSERTYLKWNRRIKRGAKGRENGPRGLPMQSRTGRSKEEGSQISREYSTRRPESNR